MTVIEQTPELGRIGVWRHAYGLTPDYLRAVERLGYGTLWLGGSPPADLRIAEEALDATSTLTIATGITNIWSAPAAEVAESFHRIEAGHPGRFLLGVGAGHREANGSVYAKPYEAVVSYLDELDTAGVPASRRVLAALGPKMLRLAAERSAGAHPYLTPPEHTREARELLGTGTLLAPEHKVVVSSDAAAARTVGRAAVENPYLHLSNYVANLVRLGFTDEELADGGSDRVIDALVAHGDAGSVAARLTEHLDAGADHVAVQVLPADGDALPALTALAAALGLSS
ncbi:LLM class F420-dependent oxidoreductase [Rhodococcus spelaei]|uniref:LLM class F420-dependent oxidoreductase n=1 Tax=Rhodococcus spelaei TaxID=2546320 RepID=A0A541AZR9_9NOCA|nr:LLM class F420-dependent oxidoreductase [Rhodococcus spelaei]TQF65569.1 LLM class F420-dependent oxidoreductase [Rhodococcus spelaei]